MERFKRNYVLLIFILIVALFFSTISILFFSNEKDINSFADENLPNNTDGFWADEEKILNWFEEGSSLSNLFGGGLGTEDDPYLISNSAQLALVSYMAYNSYNFEGEYIKLISNIDMSEYYWQPIGIYYDREGYVNNKPFSGTFDGDGHTIRGLYTPAGNSNSYSYQGLFGNIDNNATIKNIRVADSYIYGYRFCGGIVGLATSVTIENCCFEGVISSSGTFTGGIVGSATGSVLIKNCYSLANITSQTSYVGGLAGYLQYSTILNSYNNQTVKSVDGRVGGIAGYSYESTIINCYNKSSVSTDQNYAGGIVGYAQSGSISYCYNYGNVTSGDSSAGGIIGNQYSFATKCYYGGSCKAGGINGKDVAGQAEIKSDLSYSNFQSKSFFTSSTNWNSAYAWDLENVWMNGADGLEGSLTLRIFYWIGVASDNVSNNGSYYYINSEEDFAWVAKQVLNGNSFVGKTIILQKNLDFSDKIFCSIGNDDHCFSGNFDGKGFSIKNAYGNNIFGLVVAETQSVGYIQNLSWANEYNDLYYNASINSLGLIGELQINVENVTLFSINNINLNFSMAVGLGAAGGIVGSVKLKNPYSVTGDYDKFGHLTISNCIVNAEVTTLFGSAGGIIGQITVSSYQHPGNTIYIQNCHVQGFMQVGLTNAGGIIGNQGSLCYVNIENCSVDLYYDGMPSLDGAGIICSGGSSTSLIKNCVVKIVASQDFADRNHSLKFSTTTSANISNVIYELTIEGGTSQKKYKGTDFSAFVWLNNSIPVLKDMSWITEFMGTAVNTSNLQTNGFSAV